MTLGLRLTLHLLAIFIFLCGVAVYYGIWTADRYFQSVTQELSAPIAMYVAERRPPFRDGEFDAEQFRELARIAMILNPAIDIYALDAAGRVLAQGSGEHVLARGRIDLAPLRQFMAGASVRPLLGEDPRDATRRRIFSAAAVGPSRDPWGYVYVILDSSARQALAARTWPQQLSALAGGGLAVMLLAGFIVAAVLFARLTMPLRALAREVSAFESQLLAREEPAQREERDEISRLRRGFERLRTRVTEQMQALQRADAARREWIAHLSHDLRAPLTTLQAHLENALRRDGIASASERREAIARGLLHCSQVRRLLSELFESARLEAPTLELHAETFELAELVQDAVAGLREPIEGTGVRVECDIETSGSTRVQADIALFQRLLENLLANAVKASRGSGVVVVSVRRSGPLIVLSISDSGKGPTADMLSVFNEGREPALGAAGLGLRIVAQILRLHDLRSRVEETSGGGSRVCIELPAADAATAPALALQY